MHAWTVAGGLIESNGSVLLVQNRRRDGSLDWTTPGGVVDAGESLVQGLTREVAEETGLIVGGWSAPVWTVDVEAIDLGWTLHVEVLPAVSFDGAIVIDDPDGIVVAVDWLDVASCRTCLLTSWLPAREPMLEWLAGRWDGTRRYRYSLAGGTRDTSEVTRLE